MSVSTVSSAARLVGLLSGPVKQLPLERSGYELSGEAAGTPNTRPTGMARSIKTKLASLATPGCIAAAGNAFSSSG